MICLPLRMSAKVSLSYPLSASNLYCLLRPKLTSKKAVLLGVILQQLSLAGLLQCCMYQFYFKMQGLTGQRVVGIDLNMVFRNFVYNRQDFLSFGAA